MQPRAHADRSRSLTLVLLVAALGAVVASPLRIPAVRAQDNGILARCAQWEVAMFVPNTDDAQPELLPLGIPRPFDPFFSIPPPRTVENAAFMLPGGWEPLGFGPATGPAVESAVLARRCAD